MVYSNPLKNEMLYIILAFLEATYFVNAVGLFYLASLVEKKNAASSSTKKGITSVALPIGIIEGFETMIFYQIFIILPNYLAYSLSLFAILVSITIVTRRGAADPNPKTATNPPPNLPLPPLKRTTNRRIPNKGPMTH